MVPRFAPRRLAPIPPEETPAQELVRRTTLCRRPRQSRRFGRHPAIPLSGSPAGSARRRRRPRRPASTTDGKGPFRGRYGWLAAMRPGPRSRHLPERYARQDEAVGNVDPPSDVHSSSDERGTGFGLPPSMTYGVAKLKQPPSLGKRLPSELSSVLGRDSGRPIR